MEGMGREQFVDPRQSIRAASMRSVPLTGLGGWETPKRASESNAHRRRIATFLPAQSSISRRSGTLVFRTSALKDPPHGELVEPSAASRPILACRFSTSRSRAVSAPRPTPASNARAAFSKSRFFPAHVWLGRR